MSTTTHPPIIRPEKTEQVASLMRLVFEANPGVRMTRQDIEAYVPAVETFSKSTRQRALWVLCNRGVIRWNCANGTNSNDYWMPVRAECVTK